MEKNNITMLYSIEVHGRASLREIVVAHVLLTLE